MDRTRPKHPSGRPIVRRVVKERPIWRIPDEGPITPRLQPGKDRTHAIGFHHHYEERNDDDE